MPEAPPRPAVSAGRTAFLVLFLCFACNLVGRGIGDSYTVFILPLSSDFGWSRTEVSSVYSVYLVITGLVSPLTGLLMDRWGAKLVYPLGLALLGLGSLVAGQLTQLWQFYLCIGLLGGMGVSMLGMVPASMLISRWFRTRTSTALGVAYAGFGTGTLVIVPLAQYLIERQGWRDTYNVMGIAALAVVPLFFLLPWREIAGEAREKARQARAAGGPNPLWQAMRTRAYWQLVQVFSFTSLSMFAIFAQVVPYLVESGLTPLQAASAFGTAGMLSIFGMSASGWGTDRIGVRATATTTFACTFIGLVMLMALSFTHAAWLVVPYVIFFGMSQGARGPIIATLAARHFGGPGFATIYGTMFTFMSIGAAFGSWISGVLYDATGGYRTIFLYSMVTIVIAAAPFWTRRPLTTPG